MIPICMQEKLMRRVQRYEVIPVSEQRLWVTSLMTDDKIQWTINLIKKLQEAEMEELSRLEAIKSALEQDKQISENDKKYLKEKYVKLEENQKNKTEPDSEIVHNPLGQAKKPSEIDSALINLIERLAKGEISPDQYDSLRKKTMGKYSGSK